MARKKEIRNKGNKITLGASIKDVGNSDQNKTGNWRSMRPVFDKKKCTQCMICWMYCPDMAIPQKLGKRLDFDYDYCKGCGICAKECIFDAIKMEKEMK